MDKQESMCCLVSGAAILFAAMRKHHSSARSFFLTLVTCEGLPPSVFHDTRRVSSRSLSGPSSPFVPMQATLSKWQRIKTAIDLRTLPPYASCRRFHAQSM